MRKIFSILLSLTVLLALYTPTVFASENAYNIVGDRRIVEELLSEGLNQDDAEYYAALDKFVKELESKGQEIDFSDAEDLDDEWVRVNSKEFRNRILKGDKAAIKKAVLNQAYLNGKKDIKELQERDKKSGNFRNKYTVKYPDGSSISLSGETIKEEDINGKVSTNTNIDGPWDESNWIKQTTFNNAGNYTSITEWRYLSGVNYSKVKDITRWGYNPVDDYHCWLISNDGASASYGVVQVASEDKENNIYSDSRDTSGFCGYTDVRFLVSGAFTASYSGLGINVGVNGTWHQYAVTEIFGPFCHHWAAQYA